MSLTVEMMQQLADEINDYGWGEVTVHERYSGRGMYGKDVPALVWDGGAASLSILIGWCARELVEHHPAWAGVVAEDLPGRSDSMGLGVVVY